MNFGCGVHENGSHSGVVGGWGWGRKYSFMVTLPCGVVFGAGLGRAVRMRQLGN